MAKKQWETQRKSDSDVIENLIKLAELAPDQSGWRITAVVGEGGATTVSEPIESIAANTIFKQIVGIGDFACQRIAAEAPPGYSFQIIRHPNSSTDQVEIAYPDHIPLPTALPIIAEALSRFQQYSKAAVIERRLGKDVAEFYRARDFQLVRLEGLQRKFMEEIVESKSQLDKEFAAERAALIDSIERRKAELESNYAEKHQELDAARNALDVRKKELDDRGSMHARRDMRVKLQDELQKREQQFSLSKSTLEKRRVLHGLFCSLIVIGLAFVAVTVFEGLNAPKDYVYGLRLGFGFAGILTTFFLYIRWNDEWFRQHADEEFRFKRLRLDIDRASWLVELVMEYQDKKQSDIPAQLLTDLARDLFTARSSQSSMKHPVEDIIGAILVSTSSLQATFDAKSAKRLKSAIEPKVGE